MPEIIEQNTVNMIVQSEDGSVDVVTRSPMNRLLFDHNLWGVLRAEDDILVLSGQRGQQGVTLTPTGDDHYRLELDEAADDLHLGPHQKHRLIDALQEVYEGETQEVDGTERRSTAPLVRLYTDIRANMVRDEVIAHVVNRPPLSEAVEVVTDGLLIHDHLLLTWEGEFYHPQTTSRSVSGSTVQMGASEDAYRLRFGHEEDPPSLVIDGETYLLTRSEMEFIAKAVWGVTKAPREIV